MTDSLNYILPVSESRPSFLSMVKGIKTLTYECNVTIGFVYRCSDVLASKIRKTRLNPFIIQRNVDLMIFQVGIKRFNVIINFL